MKRTIRYSLAPLLLTLLALAAPAHAQWTVPTDEELKMTSQPEVPGAAAVYLFREEITDDKIHMWSVYVRLKVLTEAGKEYANVEVRQNHVAYRTGYTVNDIEGRTIHSDGTIVPFTEKPFDKLIEQGQGYKESAKVFTMPDVQVGSILEYRYKLRYEDNLYFIPDWYIQSRLYTRKAHYAWKEMVATTQGDTGTVLWTPILPAGAQVTQQSLPSSVVEPAQVLLELNVHDIPPMPDEEYMPPIDSLSYRVLFYFSAHFSVDEFWKSEGKTWSKARERFIGPGAKVKEAANSLVAPSDTQDQKLRKLYAAVMKLDNSAYNRDRSHAEEKSQGLGDAKSTDDIWERKRGTDDHLTELFVAMARAAGMKAYVMAVASRDSRVFLANYLSFSQLDDLIAVVEVDGKEQFFDPGQRYCPYGHLAWKHSLAQGVRQVDGGTAIATTPSEPFTASRTQRSANFTMNEHGEVTGTVKMIWTGAPALRWRQASLRGDITSLNRDLREAVERLMPGGMEVKVTGIEQLNDYEQPFTVNYEVKGGIASSTGKRLLLPGDIFEANSKPTFPHAQRETPVYFNYPCVVQDAVRVNFPAALVLESLPASEKLPFQKSAVYSLSTESTATSLTVRREFDLGKILYSAAEYADLRAFYNKLETKDQETAVLKAATPSGAGVGAQ